MTAIYPLILVFLQGGFGKMAEAHLIDPNVAISIGMLLTWAVGHFTAKHDPNKGKPAAQDKAP